MVYEREIWLKSYYQGVGADIAVNNCSLMERLDQVRASHGQRPAYFFLGSSLTYERLMDLADRFANCLAAHGLGKGDVVGIHLPNTPQYLVAALGALRAGCVVSGVSPLLAPGEIAGQLADSGARALVTLEPLFQAHVRPILARLPKLKLVMPTQATDFLAPWEKILAGPTPQTAETPAPEGPLVLPLAQVPASYPPQPPAVELGPDDAAFLQYTGGTTGLPKGALLTHGNLLASVNQFGAWLQCGQSEDIFISGFPMFHIAGLFVALISLHYGYAQALVPDPRDTDLIIKQINALKPTLMANVPSLWLLLLDNPAFATADFSRLKVAVTAASPIPEEKMRELESILGAGKVSEFYGMTECSPIISLNPIQGRKVPRSVGLPVPSTWVRIMDLGLGEKDAPLGEVGEVVVSGPQVMKGYYNQPQETTGVLRERDGRLWIRTGDVGRMDADGYLYLVDRSKDMINISGYKVFPRELEEKIFSHPAIASCAVVGMADPARPGNEMVKLVATLSPASQGRPEEEVRQELTAFLRAEMAPYKVPKIIEFRAQIPLTSVGKVDKKALR